LIRVLEAKLYFVTRPSSILMARDQKRDLPTENRSSVCFKRIVVYLLLTKSTLVCEFWSALHHTFYSNCEVSVLELKLSTFLFNDSQIM
jgi:hypothetical protein